VELHITLDLEREELRGQHHPRLAVPFGQAIIGRLGIERTARVLVEADGEREVIHPARDRLL